MPLDDPVTRTRSSANPLDDDRSPWIVLYPTPVFLRARSSALNTKLNSSGDSLSPCLVPLVSVTVADLP